MSAPISANLRGIREQAAGAQIPPWFHLSVVSTPIHQHSQEETHTYLIYINNIIIFRGVCNDGSIKERSECRCDFNRWFCVTQGGKAVF